MTRVRQLPDHLADKIAAGEVVERPASVVKELAENSLDAGADRIRVTIRGGGLKLIRVRDNGQGMGRADAELALKRHATSKIIDEEDLFRISTMGFRGEALPAIASVSRLELVTRPADSKDAVRITVEGGHQASLEQVAGPVGTSVTVRDLFFNTPARLKFIKTKRTENAWIKEILIRLALAHPRVGFGLTDGDRSLLSLEPVGKTLDRLSDVLGRADSERLIRIGEDHPAVRVKGWVSPVEAARSSSKAVYFFVNGRFIRDRVLLNGLLAGFQGRLERGRYPLAVIFLDLEPGTLDVNVHPAKLEVRFHHAQAIRQALVRAVSMALNAEERFIWTGPITTSPGMAVREESTPPAPPGGTGSGSGHSYKEWLKDSQKIAPTAYEYGAGSMRMIGRLALQAQEQPKSQSGFRYLGTYAGLYLVGQVEDDLILIDQHAAHERLLFERLKAGEVQSQPLLSPEKVTLEPVQAEGLGQNLEHISALGFTLEPFGPDGRTFVVKAVPTVLGSLDPVSLIRELADGLDRGGTKPDSEAVRTVLAGIACHQAVRAGKEMSRPEVETLVDDLGQLGGPLTCPHGRPLIKRITRTELDRWFKRT